MSILRKIPKIEQVLDNMSIESLKRLESLMNSGNGATETYTLFGGENKLNYVNKDLGVWYCNIELERNKSVETGFLIWESQTKALFVSFDITQCLKEYEIDLTNYTYVKINEKLSIEEFRRVLEDNINKEVVHIDTSGNVEVGKNLVVDGKVILNGKEDLVDTSGNVLISGGASIKNYLVSILPSEIEVNSGNTKWLNFKGNGLEKMSNLFSFLINNENKILKIHASFNLYASDEAMYYYYNGDGSFHKMFDGEGNLVNVNAVRENFLFNETLIAQDQPIINDYLEMLETFTISVTYYE